MFNLNRYPKAVHTSVATPSSGMIPITKPRATVSASFVGERPVVSKPNNGATSLRLRYFFGLRRYKVRAVILRVVAGDGLY